MAKLLAEWFWIDRWMGSSAFLLPIEPRGLYREMMTAAWRRDCRLPNDPEAIRRAVGCTRAEWSRCWPKVKRYWRVDGDALVNDTQLEVWAETQAAKHRASERGRKGGLAKALSSTLSSAQAQLEQNSSTTQAQLEQNSSTIQAGSQALLEHKPPSPYVRTYVRTERDQEFVSVTAESLLWFDRIWAKYPNKERKQLAHEAWVTLNPPNEVAATILRDVEQRVKAGWSRFERRFIPQLRNYLLERQWEDGAAEPDLVYEEPTVQLPRAWVCASCGEVHEGTREQERAGVCLKEKTS